jgi:hypothetical protein
MSDTVEQPKKHPHRSPEWVAQMRIKAGAKKAENKRVKDALKAKAEDERKKKLQEADEILNPKPKVEPRVEPQVEQPDNEPIEAPQNIPIKKTKKKAVIVDSDEEELDYKQAYYKAKLKQLKQPPQQQNQEVPPVTMAYDVAKQNVKQHFNKAVMKNLWNTYFREADCPY